MRKTWGSRNTLDTTFCSSRARLEVGPERLLDDAAHVGLRVPVQLGALDLLDDHREELRRGREVVVAVERLARLVVELVERLREAPVAVRVVERGGDVGARARAARRAPRRSGCGASTCRSSRGTPARKSSWLLLAPRDADELEPLGQRALVREVVERGQQLAVREVAGRAEDDERGGRDRAAARAPRRAGSRACRPPLRSGPPSAQPPPAVRSTACPPNWPRSAASTLCV